MESQDNDPKRIPIPKNNFQLLDERVSVRLATLVG